MTSFVVAMFVILGIAVGTAGVVVVGIQGRGKARVPRLADKMARVVQHLNGDAQPPRG